MSGTAIVSREKVLGVFSGGSSNRDGSPMTCAMGIGLL